MRTIKGYFYDQSGRCWQIFVMWLSTVVSSIARQKIFLIILLYMLKQGQYKGHVYRRFIVVNLSNVKVVYIILYIYLFVHKHFILLLDYYK